MTLSLNFKTCMVLAGVLWWHFIVLFQTFQNGIILWWRNYCRRHLFWFPFSVFFSMKSCADPLNLNISQ